MQATGTPNIQMLYLATDSAGYEQITVVTVTTSDDFYWKGLSKTDYYPIAQCFPLAAREELEIVVNIRNSYLKQYNDSSALIYQLRNKVSRGEIK